MRFHRNICTVGGLGNGQKSHRKWCKTRNFWAQVNGRTEARRESHPPPDPRNILAGGPPRESRFFRTVGGPADLTRGLRAEWMTQPHFLRAELTRAATHGRCRGGGTRRPPPCSRSPTRPRPRLRTRIRRARRLLRLLVRPLERLRCLPTFCTARRSSGPRPGPAALWRESPAHRSTQRSE